ncbi:HAD-IC family P-type ATPase [Streptomyces sp. NBC_00669]|uniref:HAD-IC family P-type ATPase n=1 Tax=Streptomyces sp. NBC_00669 TaxID=2976011 RepID=UPI003FA6A38B
MAWAPDRLAGSARPLAAPQRDDLADATALEVLRGLESGPRGLTETEAEERLARYGENSIPGWRPASWPRRYARSLRDPFTAILLGLGLVSALVTAWGTACVITVLVLVSSALRSRTEYQADRSADGLRHLVAATATVQRRSAPGAAPRFREIPVVLLVPGDVIRLGPGDVIPADVRLLRTQNLTLHQAALTGESAPAAKRPDDVPRAAAGMFERAHACFQGSSVASGSGTALVTATGAATEFARAYRGPGRRRESAFDRAVNGISWILIRFMLLTPPLVLLADAALRGRGLETLPFAVAVAVGLTPEMLPVVVTTVLARKAAALARDHDVIVRWLPALHNVGAIDVLCTDKTGTLTCDQPVLDSSLDAFGRPDPEVLHWAAVNSLWTLQLADLPAPDALDEAVLDAATASAEPPADSLTAYDAYDGVAALPFDPVRRLATAVVRRPGHRGLHTLVTKGSVEEVLRHCTRLRAAPAEQSGTVRELQPDPNPTTALPDRKNTTTLLPERNPTTGEPDPTPTTALPDRNTTTAEPDPNPTTLLPARKNPTTGERDLDDSERERLLALAAGQAAQGLRLLAVAVAERPARLGDYGPADEQALTFAGFVVLRDAPADTAADALAALADRGVAVKVLTGDHPGTAARVCRDLGLEPGTLLTGDRIDGMDDTDLARQAEHTTVFARCTPQHKVRVVRALRAAGHTTGFLGDGVNDLPALHAADVGICPRDAVDVTREAADVVLAAKDLTAIDHTITAGRHSTGTIATYLRIALSSNLGNVIAMLVAGLLLPFLPMLPAQVLLQNLCFDAAQLALAYDQPGPDALRHPSPLRTHDFLRFITAFGLLNAAADLATFAALALIVPASAHISGQAAFHSGWFTENLITQALVMVLLRSGTRAPLPIRTAAAGLAAIGLLLPLPPLAHILGMTTLPLTYYLLLASILAVYTVVLFTAKSRHLRRYTPPFHPQLHRV